MNNDCDGPLADHVSRDNTPLRNVRIIRLTERISVMHRYSYQRYTFRAGEALAISRVSFGTLGCRYIPENKLNDIQSIVELVSDPDGDWYLSNSIPVGEDIPVPPDVEVGGDNDASNE